MFWSIFFILAALAVSFLMLVWYGPRNYPRWLYHIAPPIIGIGGGMAVSMLIQKALGLN